jgi:hypothetical protein
MNVRQGVTVDLVGSLGNYGNCEVGVFEFNGVTLKNQMYEIYVRQEWARANDLMGTIKLSEYLMGTKMRDPDPHCNADPKTLFRANLTVMFFSQLRIFILTIKLSIHSVFWSRPIR